MEYKIEEQQYNQIYRWFKTTSEPFDDLDWSGKQLNVWLNSKIVERYNYCELYKIGILGK
ncbi:MAG: hypothetical protein LBS63_05415 [Prevotellaceae bacterium]|jgi:hypothetical protein|nr:hypothetical protein [Prevotellaceae bacterium]